VSEPRNVVIVGLGLMGGSLARALKRVGPAFHVSAITPERDTVERALADGAIDRAADDAAAAFAAADVVVYATPVASTLELLEEHAPLLRASRAAVTDVCSVMLPVVTRARSLELARFVGAHPLCGGERSGYAAARPELYDGARVYLVGAADPSADETVAALWRAAGAFVEPIDAGLHDERMAWISHLPQVLASALAVTLAREHIEPGQLGPGGRDMTRLAGSSPDLWVEILRANRHHVVPALRALVAGLQRSEEALAAGDDEALVEMLRRGRDWREEGRT
jgi:prephenate dehydrogenase